MVDGCNCGHTAHGLIRGPHHHPFCYLHRTTTGLDMIPLARNVPIPEKSLRDGYYWFKCDRGEGIRSMGQLSGGKWYAFNEHGALTLAELNRRGWTLDKRVKYRRKKHV